MQSLFGRAQAALAETKDQFNRTDQIASAVEEMSLTSNTISEDMVSLAKETEQIQQQGNQGRDRMDNILGSISSLSHEVEGGFQAVQQVTDQTEQISSILQTIESIAEQTNLLALNAAIEAARAGEQGRGFAVVADEVRSLADQSRGTAQEISTSIHTMMETLASMTKQFEVLREAVDEARETSGVFGKTLRQSAESAYTVNTQAGQITQLADVMGNSMKLLRNAQRAREDVNSILNGKPIEIRHLTDIEQKAIDLAEQGRWSKDSKDREALIGIYDQVFTDIERQLEGLR